MAIRQSDKKAFSWVIADEVWRLKARLAAERDCARRRSIEEEIQAMQHRLSEQAMLEYRSAVTN